MAGNFPNLHERGVQKSLDDWLQDERLTELANERGPLYVEELPPSIIASEEFQTVLANFGWPDKVNTGGLVGHEFVSDAEFWDALCNKDNPLTLNNFIGELIQEPRDHFAGQYGYLPASHRVNLVAPDFMQALRPALGAEWDRVAEAYDARYLTSPQELQTAAHLAYKLMCRLITNQDSRKKLEFLGLNGWGELPVTSIRDYLFHDS